MAFSNAFFSRFFGSFLFLPEMKKTRDYYSWWSIKIHGDLHVWSKVLQPMIPWSWSTKSYDPMIPKPNKAMIPWSWSSIRYDPMILIWEKLWSHDHDLDIFWFFSWTYNPTHGKFLKFLNLMIQIFIWEMEYKKYLINS